MDVSLVMFKSDGSRREFSITRGRVVVGRKNTCDLRIPLSSVSRQHCEIRIDGENLRLRDLGSSNGTFLNGTRVQEAELSAGDTLEVGPVVFTVVVEGKPEQIEPIRTVLSASDTGTHHGPELTRAEYPRKLTDEDELVEAQSGSPAAEPEDQLDVLSMGEDTDAADYAIEDDEPELAASSPAPSPARPSADEDEPDPSLQDAEAAMEAALAQRGPQAAADDDDFDDLLDLGEASESTESADEPAEPVESTERAEPAKSTGPAKAAEAESTEAEQSEPASPRPEAPTPIDSAEDDELAPIELAGDTGESEAESADDQSDEGPLALDDERAVLASSEDKPAKPPADEEDDEEDDDDPLAKLDALLEAEEEPQDASNQSGQQKAG